MTKEEFLCLEEIIIKRMKNSETKKYYLDLLHDLYEEYENDSNKV